MGVHLDKYKVPHLKFSWSPLLVVSLLQLLGGHLQISLCHPLLDHSTPWQTCKRVDLVSYNLWQASLVSTIVALRQSRTDFIPWTHSFACCKRIGQHQALGLILLVGTHIVPQVKFQESIDPLGLPIALRMKTSEEVKLGPHKLALRSKSPCEASGPITHYRPGKPQYLTTCLKNKWTACSVEHSLNETMKVAYLEYRSIITSTHLHASLVGNPRWSLWRHSLVAFREWGEALIIPGVHLVQSCLVGTQDKSSHRLQHHFSSEANNNNFLQRQVCSVCPNVPPTCYHDILSWFPAKCYHMKEHRYTWP